MLQKSIKKRYSNTKAHLRRKAGKSHLLAKKNQALGKDVYQEK